MISLVRDLWPEDEPAPLLRLLRGMVLAPMVLSLLLAAGAFLISGTARAERAAAVAAALDSAISLTALVFLFTFTLGLLGVMVLGYVASRGLLVWALTGGLLGALGGVIFGVMVGGAPNRVMILAFAVLGWVLFLLLRWFAGIRAPGDKR
ncbi:MAG: hypothetical protein AAGH68_03640 [Pseudomonadota bacterium]